MATVTPWGNINWGGVNALSWDPLTQNSPYERMARDTWRDAFLESSDGAGLADYFRNTSSAYGNVTRQQYAYADAMAQLENLLSATGNTSSTSAPGANLFQRQGTYLNNLAQGALPMAAGASGNYAQELLDALAKNDDKSVAIATALRTPAGRQAITEALTARAGLGGSGFGRIGMEGIIRDAQNKAFGDPDEFKWLRNIAGAKTLWGTPAPQWQAAPAPTDGTPTGAYNPSNWNELFSGSYSPPGESEVTYKPKPPVPTADEFGFRI